MSKATKIKQFDPNSPGASNAGIYGLPFTAEEAEMCIRDRVKIEWTGEQSVRLYQVQMSTTDPAVTPAWTLVTLTSKRQHTVPDLEPYRMYWFRIIAVNTAGESLPSDVLMARAA